MKCRNWHKNSVYVLQYISVKIEVNMPMVIIKIIFQSMNCFKTYREGEWENLVGATSYRMSLWGVCLRQYGSQSPAEPSPVVWGLKWSEMMVTCSPGIFSWANTAVLSPIIPAPITATWGPMACIQMGIPGKSLFLIDLMMSVAKFDL